MSRRLKRWAGLAVMLLALTACAHGPALREAPEFPLLPPSSFGGSLQVTQVLRAAYGGEESSLQAVVQISPQLLQLTGLSALGQRLFIVQYDGQTLQSPVAEVPARRIVTDLQFAFWPLAPLIEAVAGTDWKLSEPEQGLRRLYWNSRLAAEARTLQTGTPLPRQVWLSNFAQDYSLDIRSD